MRASAYDRIVYESQLKPSYEERTPSSAAHSATRSRHWLNWARAVSSSKRRSFHATEPDVGPNQREGQPGIGAHGTFHARKSRSDYPRRIVPWHRHWRGAPLRCTERAKTRDRSEIASRNFQLDSSLAPVSVAIL